MKKIFAVLIAIILMTGAVVGLVSTGQAANGDEPCVPSDAYTETIEHPEVSHNETVTVVDQEAWTETVPGVAAFWANFAPNNNNAPFIGPPFYPSDPRGTWIVHNNDGGPGQDQSGVYPIGNPHKGGNWFYREQGTPDTFINHPEVSHEETVKVVDEEAWTETIEHPAVVCETDEPTPTDDPTETVDPTDDPSESDEPTDEPTVNPTPPTVNPEVGNAVRAWVERTCEYRIYHSQEFVNGKWKDTKVEYVATGRDCSKSAEAFIQEEGF